MFRRGIAAVAAGTLALALAACSGSGDGGGQQPGGETAAATLRLTAVAAPTSLDPASGEWGNRSPFYQAVFDSLLRLRADGAIEPWLATDWEYDESATRLELTLRDDVVFTDGSALNADVVVANLQRFKDGTAANAAFLKDVDSFEVVDEHTVALHLSRPNPTLLMYLAREAGFIGSADSFDDPDLATAPVGSGPYVLDEDATVVGTTYAYERNPDYWNPDAQHYDEVVISVMPDPTAALNALKAGEANGVKLVSNAQRAEAEQAGWTVVASQVDVQGLFLFDRAGSLAEPLADVRVRQAINHAIDREGVLEAVVLGHGIPTAQIFSPDASAYDAALDDRYEYDLDEAKRLLAEAGYPDGFTLQLPSSAALGTTVFNVVQQQLAGAGITVEFTEVQATNLISDLLQAKYPATYFALESLDDWWVIEAMVSPQAVWNPFRSEDPEVTALIDQVRAGDETASAELNEYLVEQAWFAPFYRADAAYAVDANTTVEPMSTNTYPSLLDFAPKS